MTTAHNIKGGFLFGLTISLLNVLISKEVSMIQYPTNEQMEALRQFIVNGKHRFYDDAVNFFNGTFDNRSLRNALRKARWFVTFRMCEYCHKEMIVTRDFYERKYCCKEHRILYHNKFRHIKICECEYCGEEFYPFTYRRGRFCSRHCAAMFREAAKREKK